MRRKILLVCGIAASAIYVGTDPLAASHWPGYSFAGQTMSELSAIGAPSRSLVVPLILVYCVLVIAFGWGVWKSSDGKGPLRGTGGLLMAFGAFSVMGPFTPMHLRETLASGGGTTTDTLHLLGAGGDVVFILLIMGLGAIALGKRFRIYSIVTIVIVLAFGAWTGWEGTGVPANLPTPWIGVSERICVYGYMVWQAALAIALLRTGGQDARGSSGQRQPGFPGGR